MFEIYNCKERFGYTYLWTCNKKIQNVLLDYCEKRSALWRIFLGWRKTTCENKMFFWIPSRKLDNLIEIAKNI